MRKLYLLFLIVFLHIAYISARPQMHDTARIYIGTSHGIIGSGVFFNPSTISQNFILGYNGGITFNYEAQKGRSLQIEVNFSQRGWKESSDTYAYSRRLNYIEMPFLAQYYFGNKSTFTLNLGPKIGFLLSDKKLENTYIPPEGEDPPEQHNDIKNKFDYGIAAGLGYKLFLKKQVFTFEIRGTFSLGTLFSNSAGSDFSNSNNANVAINLGWMIRVK